MQKPHLFLRFSFWATFSPLSKEKKSHKLCLFQTAIDKRLGEGLVPRRVHKIAQAVAGIGEGVAGDQGWVGGCHGLGHGGGNKAVVVAVDDLDGDGGMLHRLVAAEGPKAEPAAEEEGAHLQEGPQKPARCARLVRRQDDDVLWHVVGAVGQNALDAPGQAQGRGHEHRGGAHADAVEEQRRVGEAFGAVAGPHLISLHGIALYCLTNESVSCLESSPIWKMLKHIISLTSKSLVNFSNVKFCVLLSTLKQCLIMFFKIL